MELNHGIKKAYLSVTMVDNLGNTIIKGFETVERLASFLLAHPEVGKAVGYVPKSKKKQ